MNPQMCDDLTRMPFLGKMNQFVLMYGVCR